MSKTTSRRAVLAGIAATPALAAPALALTIAGPDPIFALIEQHRVAYAAVCAAVDATDAAAGEYGGWGAPKVKPFEEAQTAVTVAMMELEGELAETAPTTLHGILAIMRYRREFATMPLSYDLFEAKGADEAWLETIEQSITQISGESVS
jgi:hypothetical protein